MLTVGGPYYAATAVLTRLWPYRRHHAQRAHQGRDSFTESVNESASLGAGSAGRWSARASNRRNSASAVSRRSISAWSQATWFRRAASSAGGAAGSATGSARPAAGSVGAAGSVSSLSSAGAVSSAGGSASSWIAQPCGVRAACRRPASMRLRTARVVIPRSSATSATVYRPFRAAVLLVPCCMASRLPRPRPRGRYRAVTVGWHWPLTAVRYRGMLPLARRGRRPWTARCRPLHCCWLLSSS
jgi:hypothetical protein